MLEHYSKFFSLVTVTLWLIFPLIFSRRSFAKPPRAVQMVSECIVVMRGYKEVSWKQAKGMMSEANFLKSLTEMDVDGITTAQVLCVGLSVSISVQMKAFVEGADYF